jgi:hypothetical protein
VFIHGLFMVACPPGVFIYDCRPFLCLAGPAAVPIQRIYAMAEAAHAPPDINIRTLNMARMCNYALGGKGNCFSPLALGI